MLFGLLCAVSFEAQAQDNLVAKTQGGAGADSSKFTFTHQKQIPHTPVKNQASSSTCWSYSGLSVIETEAMRLGKGTLDLAEMYVVRKVWKDKALRYVRMQGSNTFAPGAEGPDVLDVIRKYGIVPQEVYPGLIQGEELNNHNEMDHALTEYIKGVVRSRVIRGDWMEGFNGILDRYLGPEPKEFTYNGKTYTPRTFADEVVGVNPLDYVYITSWTHLPYYEKSHLLVPDNWAWESFYNVKLDEMMSVIDNAIEKGYSVLWAADVSERGFSSRTGLAIVPADDKDKDIFDGPKEEKVITESMRQKGFDDYSTQDDHGMELVGTTQDQSGKKYYIVKNSWGTTRGRDGGYIYASVPYVQLKTISIIVHRDAVPEEILSKLK